MLQLCMLLTQSMSHVWIVHCVGICEHHSWTLLKPRHCSCQYFYNCTTRNAVIRAHCQRQNNPNTM